MKTGRVAPILATLALVVALVPAAAGAARAGSIASPSLVLGPKATPVAATTTSYGLFSCQVGQDTSGAVCYDPYQMRHAYSIDKLIAAGYTGSGKTIVIVDSFQSPNIVEELNTFDAQWDLPGLNGLGGAHNPALGTFKEIAPGGLTAFDSTNADMIGWAEEISLDVQWAHAIAPGANIVLDLARSDRDADILAATKYAVDHHLGDIISQSFGENESCVDPAILTGEHQVFAAATLKGMTIFASTGDEGAAQETCDGNSWVKAASSPAGDPLVTAVGGTELHAADYCLVSLGCNPRAHPAPGTYQGEIAWNEDWPGYNISTGGGYSMLYREPSYQQSAISGKQRGVPDISYSAAVLHGVLTYLDIPGDATGWYLFGGTSAGSPQWSAITAIADQKAHHDLGFINSALYEIGGSTKTYAAALHDVTSGNNSVVELDVNNNPVSVHGFKAGKGWDATTGLGSPTTDQLVSYLIKYVSPRDGAVAVAQSSSYSGNNPGFGGHERPH